MANNAPANINTGTQDRKVAVLVADGFDGPEVEALQTALRAAGARAELLAPRVGPVKSSQGETLDAGSIHHSEGSVFDAIYLAGGEESIKILMGHPDANRFVQEAYAQGKPLGLGAGAEPLYAAACPMSQPGTPGVVEGPERLVEAMAVSRYQDRPMKLKPEED